MPREWCGAKANSVSGEGNNKKSRTPAASICVDTLPTNKKKGANKYNKSLSVLYSRQALSRPVRSVGPLFSLQSSVDGEAGELEADAEAEALLQLLLRLVHGQVELVEARVGPREGAVPLRDGLHRERPEAAVIALFTGKEEEKKKKNGKTEKPQKI